MIDILIIRKNKDTDENEREDHRKTERRQVPGMESSKEKSL